MLAPDLVTCTHCGWVHVSVSIDFATRQVQDFNAYFFSSTPEVQALFSGPATLRDYLRCHGCGANYGMRAFRPGDCPEGVTLQPTCLLPLELSQTT